MNPWKIHAAWALVMVLISGTWGRWCATRAPEDVRIRSSSTSPLAPPVDRAGRPAELPAAKEAMPRRASPAGGAAPDPDVLPAYSFEILSLAEIRKLMKSESRPEVGRALRAIENLTDQKLRRQLILELSTTPHDTLRYQCLV